MKKMTLEFSVDWFTHNTQNLNYLFENRLKNKLDFLEIGSFEGMSSCYFLDKMPKDATLTCIDTFKGSIEHANIDLNGLRDRFISNTRFCKKSCQKLKLIETTSAEGIAKLILDRQKFDFIYIDGSHLGKDVITDACMAMHILRRGGVIVFDDYQWEEQPNLIDRPKVAIDSFLELFQNDISIIYSNYQLAIEKISS